VSQWLSWHSSASELRLGLPVGLLKKKMPKFAVHAGGVLCYDDDALFLFLQKQKEGVKLKIPWLKRRPIWDNKVEQMFVVRFVTQLTILLFVTLRSKSIPFQNLCHRISERSAFDTAPAPSTDDDVFHLFLKKQNRSRPPYIL